MKTSWFTVYIYPVFTPFIKCLNMSSLIAFSFYAALVIVRTILCSTVQTTITYTTIITIITNRSLFLFAYKPFCKPQLCVKLLTLLFGILLIISFCKHHTYSTGQRRNRNFTQGWLIYNWLSPALSCPFVFQQQQSNKSSWSRRFLFSPSRELYCDHLYMCIRIHIIP